MGNFFREMVAKQASDLHLTSGRKPLIRQFGDIVELEHMEVLESEELRDILMEIIPEDIKTEFLENGDADFAYEILDLGRFRANYFMDKNGIGAVFRLIPNKILTAEQLGFSDAVIDMCNLHKGLVVVTGPTGSGKSTTLAAMVDYINSNRSDHIITVEDPIEFVHKSKKCLINQREVGLHTKSFKSALKAALREDPDIVLIGEMRDLETIEIALETAETGHLVFGTLHTSTAASTVERIIQQFPEGKQNQVRQMLSNSLKGVIAQNLLKKKESEGRVAAMEVLVVNSAIASQIREGKTHQITSSMQMGKKEGMVLLNDSLVKLVSDEIVTEEEALKKAVEKEDLKEKLAYMSKQTDEDELGAEEEFAGSFAKNDKFGDMGDFASSSLYSKGANGFSQKVKEEKKRRFPFGK